MEKLQLSVLSPSFSLSHAHTHPFSLRWRDVEEQWNLRRLILTLFYYSPSLASELSRISMGLHSLSWWKDSCAAESLFTPMPRPRSPLEYTTSPFTSMLTSEPSKINQKQTGASHLLISCLLALFETTCWIKKRPFWDWHRWKSTCDDDILANVTETIYSAVHRLPFVLFSQHESLHLPPPWYNMIPSQNAHLY